jgi:hypothetical protein
MLKKALKKLSKLSSVRKIEKEKESRKTAPSVSHLTDHRPLITAEGWKRMMLKKNKSNR